MMCCDEIAGLIVSSLSHIQRPVLQGSDCFVEAGNSVVRLSRLSQESSATEGQLRQGSQQSVMEHMQVLLADKQCKVFAWHGRCPSRRFNTVQCPQAKTCQRTASFVCCKEAPPWNGLITAMTQRCPCLTAPGKAEKVAQDPAPVAGLSSW